LIVDFVVITRAAAKLGYHTVKREQITVIRIILQGKDVFAVLLRGYGNTLCYTCLPLIFNSFTESKSSIVTVLTPLIAIMKDQVSLLYLNEVDTTSIVGSFFETERITCGVYL
jgi:superfamily II DNA helicase RecQ